MKDKQLILGIIFASTLFFSSTKILLNNGKVDKEALDAFKKEVSLAFNSVEKEIIKVTPDTPVNKCECNGTKEIIHGDGHKTPCPCPTGQCNCAKKQEPKPEIKETIKQPEVKVAIKRAKSLRLYTSPGCIWCEVWKSNEMPSFLADGWEVEEVVTNEGRVPRTEFRINGELKLQMPYSRLSEVKKFIK